MSGSMRVALAIVAGAVILAGTYVGYREFERRRDMVYVEAAFRKLQIEMPHSAQPITRDALTKVLDRNQKCVSGSALRWDVDEVSQAVTISPVMTLDGQPAKCTGDFATERIR